MFLAKPHCRVDENIQKCSYSASISGRCDIGTAFSESEYLSDYSVFRQEVTIAIWAIYTAKKGNRFAICDLQTRAIYTEKNF